ncbi:MAG: hypothetical protein U0441_02125 [Polyangiaceae bacterium]
MAPPPAAAISLPGIEADPVWAAALAAPLCTEPLDPEDLAAFEKAIEDVRSGRVRPVPEEEVRAEIEAMRRRAGE